MKKIIDLTHVLNNETPVFPGDTQITVTHDRFVKKDGHNNFLLKTGMHVGTHIDSPMHFKDTHNFISTIDLTQFTSMVKVISFKGKKEISLNSKVEEKIRQHDNVLIHTGFDKKWCSKEYYTEYPLFNDDIIDFFIHKKVSMIGMDTPSPDAAPYPLHEKILGNNILIIENLTNLGKLLKYNHIRLFAFPLKIDADSSLIRAAAEVS